MTTRKALTTEQGAEKWATEQTNETLREWAAKMNASNQQKANWSRGCKEMMMAATMELRNRQS